jgi:3-phenylpropionate/trans-cinnamate dioxygenase ferredoxin reductase component
VDAGVVIVGGGQGGYQAAASLRTEGYQGPVTIVSQEPHFPYQRPPLSKAFVLGKQDLDRLFLRPEAYYADHDITLLRGENVVSIDRANSTLELASGSRLPYRWLILATGARNRVLDVPGSEVEGVYYLRTVDEASAIKRRLALIGKVVVIGGGFIGLEIAATARVLGKEVVVLETLPRLIARAVAPVVSEFFLEAHRREGVEVRLDARVVSILDMAGQVSGVVLEDQTVLPADLAIIGIGVIPNVELALAAGLAISNGIAVDEYLRTSDKNIFAIGDCAEYPHAHAGGRVRLESVQNAVDHAVAVARTIAGRPAAYTAIPWFWSDQFDIRLQMAGLSLGFDQTVIRGMMESRKFSVFYFRDRQLLGIDSINRPADHMAARKLIAARKPVTPEQAADEAINLKDL